MHNEIVHYSNMTKYFQYKIRYVGIDHYISSSGLKSSDDDTVLLIV